MAITDLIIIIAFVFIIALCFVIGVMLKDSIFPQMKTSMPDAAWVFDDVAKSFNVLDAVFLVCAFGFGLSTILLASQIDTHPAFFFISLFITIISIMLSAVFSNIFGTIAKTSAFTAAADSMPFMRLILQNYPIFILMIGSIVTIVLFAKTRGGGNE